MLLESAANILAGIYLFKANNGNNVTRSGSRAAATSKMECFVIIVNGFQPLTIITKCSILDVVAVLDPPLGTMFRSVQS